MPCVIRLRGSPCCILTIFGREFPEDRSEQTWNAQTAVSDIKYLILRSLLLRIFELIIKESYDFMLCACSHHPPFAPLLVHFQYPALTVRASHYKAVGKSVKKARKILSPWDICGAGNSDKPALLNKYALLQVQFMNFKSNSSLLNMKILNVLIY